MLAIIFSFTTANAQTTNLFIRIPDPIIVRAYPNPVINFGSQITIEATGYCNLGIYNIAGQKIIDVDLVSKPTCWQSVISTENLSKGYYVIYGNSPDGAKVSTVRIQIK